MRWIEIVVAASCIAGGFCASARAQELAPESGGRSDASPTCEEDDALTELAAAIASFARDHDGRAPSSTSLARALRASGSGLPSVRVHVERATRGEPATDVAPGNRCGAAVSGSEGGRYRAIVFAREDATFRVTDDARGAVVRARVSARMRNVEAFVLDERGRAERVATAEDGTGEVAVRMARAALPARVQISATDASGPRPVVTLDLPVRGEPAARLRALLAPATSGDSAATRAASARRGATERDASADAEVLVEQLVGVRDRAGAPQIRTNRLLSRLGREHARAMCDADRIAHVVDRERGNLERRASRVGLYARSLGEAVSRSSDPSAALGAVLGSPSHRALVLDRRWTDLGAGTAVDAQRRTCLVVVLAAWPRMR